MAFSRNVRFNLSVEQASRNIVTECTKVYNEAIAAGKSEDEAFEIRRVKAVELDEYWFHWTKY